MSNPSASSRAYSRRVANANSKAWSRRTARTPIFQRFLDQLMAADAAEVIAAERDYLRRKLVPSGGFDAAERDFRESMFGFEDRPAGGPHTGGHYGEEVSMRNVFRVDRG